ncbi:MAG: polymer-forming cytoskeletal protein [Verrucomicrobiota bacterium]
MINQISQDLRLKGALEVSDDLRIDGEIYGTIRSDAVLIIGGTARVKGEVSSRELEVVGRMEANAVVVGRCILRSTAIIVGNISAGTLAAEEGAQFYGESQVRGRGEVPLPARGSSPFASREAIRGAAAPEDAVLVS